MDWGLLEPGSHNILLRNKLFYPKYLYYLVMVLNLLLRLVWILTLSPTIVTLFGSGQIFTLVTGTLEIARRGFWNLFRTEKEQIQNCGQFKAIPDVIEIENQLISECQADASNDKNQTFTSSKNLQKGILEDEFRDVIDKKIKDK